MPDYKGIPGVATFRRDSDLRGQNRKDDTLLVAIDEQLDLYDRKYRTAKDEERFPFVTELFQTTNAWIAGAHGRSASTVAQEEPDVHASSSNVLKKGLLKILHMGKSKPKNTIVRLPTGTAGVLPPVDRKQFQAVLALFGAIEQEMADLLNTQDRRQLKKDLVRLIGQEVDADGLKTDKDFNTHKINTASERQLHKLFVENGLIYRYNLDVQGVPSQLGLCESSRMDGSDIRRRNPKTGQMESGLTGYAPFVMSLDRQFYMQKHSVQQGGVFHSTYLNGQPVAAAGTMLVENGVLKAIRGDSGHYKPEPRQIANALRALQQLGVSLAGVKVLHYEDATKADDAKPYRKAPMMATPDAIKNRGRPPGPGGNTYQFDPLPGQPGQTGQTGGNTYQFDPLPGQPGQTGQVGANTYQFDPLGNPQGQANLYQTDPLPMPPGQGGGNSYQFDPLPNPSGAYGRPIEVSAQQYLAAYN